MRVKPAGRLVILILVIGIAAGIWRWYTANHGGKLPFPLPKMAKSNAEGGGNTGDSGTGGKPDAGGDTGAGGAAGGDLVLISSATKKGWLENQVDRFNQQSGGKTTIRVRTYETRAAMQAILNSKEKPVLWSPSSPIWAQRLSEAWPQFHSGEASPVNLNDGGSFRIYLRSPMVFLTTKERARTLQPLLSGSDPWGAIRDFSLGKKTMPGMGGKFRFAHADPLNANSGFLTLGMILGDYARRHGGDPDSVANSPAFVQYLTELERGLVYDEPVRGGSAALVNAFANDTDRYTLITTYESSALEKAAADSNLAVIYPNPTAVSEQNVVVLSGKWVSDDQRKAAMEFLDFLGKPESIQDGVKSYFRPSQDGGPSLNDELSQYAGQGFKTDFNSTPLPGYQALNAAAFQWRIHVAHLSATDAKH